MRVALLGRKPIEPGSFGVVLRQPASTVFVEDGQVVLPPGVSLIGREPIAPRGLVLILLDPAETLFVEERRADCAFAYPPSAASR